MVASLQAFSVAYRPVVLVLWVSVLVLVEVVVVVASCIQPFSVLDMFALVHIVVVLQPLVLVYALHE